MSESKLEKEANNPLYRRKLEANEEQPEGQDSHYTLRDGSHVLQIGAVGGEVKLQVHRGRDEGGSEIVRVSQGQVGDPQEALRLEARHG